MPVTDQRDIRVLIPRARRAIDGPTATSSAAASTTLTDDQVKDAVADAVADVILLTGGVFGKALEVTERDTEYQAPVEYRTSAELSLEEIAVIAAQVGLTYHFNYFRSQKVSERIANEAQEWEWAISATALRDHLKALQDQRDRALEAIKDSTQAPLEAYESFLAARDAATSAAIEPWVHGAGGAAIADTRPGFWGP